MPLRYAAAIPSSTALFILAEILCGGAKPPQASHSAPRRKHAANRSQPDASCPCPEPLRPWRAPWRHATGRPAALAAESIRGLRPTTTGLEANAAQDILELLLFLVAPVDGIGVSIHDHAVTCHLFPELVVIEVAGIGMPGRVIDVLYIDKNADFLHVVILQHCIKFVLLICSFDGGMYKGMCTGLLGAATMPALGADAGACRRLSLLRLPCLS